MKVVMAVTNDLLTDRRVMRHAETLREAGCEVVCIGKRELGVKARRGWRFYAEYNVRLMLRLLRSRADIVWANDTDTLAACTLAAKLKGKKLVMDAHELFPEVPELIGRERVKRVWEWIERMMMPRCDALLTVCQSIADYYKERYGVEMVVVRNVRRVESGEWRVESGEWKVESGKWKVESGESADAGESSSLKMLLYQGAVNKGRGVDWAIDALEWLEDCRLVVAGGGDLLEEMKAYAAKKPWAERIAFMGRLMPEELEGLTRKADVGLVMLEDMGLSYHFALPNRIGDFVAAGVPMVVSDLPEMSRVVREFGVGEVIESGERRVESGERRVESGERRAESGEWRVESGERRAESGEWGVESGERGVESGDRGVESGKWRAECGERRARALAEAVRRVLAREWTEKDFEAARRDMDWDKEKEKLLGIVERFSRPEGRDTEQRN